jgi:hypothetical protein
MGSGREDKERIEKSGNINLEKKEKVGVVSEDLL